MKKHMILILLIGVTFSWLEASRGGKIAGGVAGGLLGTMLISSAIENSRQPVYYEPAPVYYERAPVYESSPTYYEEYIDDGYSNTDRHINMHQRDNVLQRTEMQRNARSELSAREAELNRRELALKQREAAISASKPSSYEADRESVYEDPFEEFSK
jgi:hypothetical protein